MSISVQAVLLLLNLLNTVLHGLALIVLICLYRRSRSKVQQLFLITLVLCEFFINLIESSKLILKLTTFARNNVEDAEKISNYLLIVQFCGFALVFYTDMIYFTADRFFEVWLNIKYPVYWDETKTTILLGLTWFVGFATCITVTILKDKIKYFWEEPFYKYIFPSTEFLFIFVAIFTYSFIFHKYKKSRIVPLETSSSSGKVSRRRQSAWEVFRKSKFYIQVLLIITFTLFFVCADFIYLFTVIIPETLNETIYSVCFISYAISNLIDAWIILVVSKPNRRWIVTKWNSIRSSRNIRVHPTTASITLENSKTFSGTNNAVAS